MMEPPEGNDRARPIPGGVLETVVYCEDLHAARRFYQDVVGLMLVSSEPDRHLFFRVGHSMLLVFRATSTRQSTVMVGDQIIPPHGANGASHFAFQAAAEDLPAIRGKLVQHGIPIESEIDWPAGGHSIYCRDPAGNSVEFATRTLWFAGP